MSEPSNESRRFAGAAWKALRTAIDTARRRAIGERTPGTLPERLRRLGDDEWLDLLVRSVSERRIDGCLFPGFPSSEVQTRFVGSAFEPTLREAREFFGILKRYAASLGKPIERTTRFLDFGCGWGRFLRFVWKDVDAANLYGCDVLPDIIEVCRETGVPGQLSVVAPNGRLPYPDGFFDAVMAFSVFTHLPEKYHLHWLAELKRVTRPGAIVTLTLEPRRFLDFIASIPEDAPSGWHQGLRKFAPQLEELYARFDAGELAYLETGGGQGLDAEHYGDAVVPLAFVRRHWEPELAIRDYDDGKIWQAILVAQRT